MTGLDSLVLSLGAYMQHHLMQGTICYYPGNVYKYVLLSVFRVGMACCRYVRCSLLVVVSSKFIVVFHGLSSGRIDCDFFLVHRNYNRNSLLWGPSYLVFVVIVLVQ